MNHHVPKLTEGERELSSVSIYGHAVEFTKGAGSVIRVHGQKRLDAWSIDLDGAYIPADVHTLLEQNKEHIMPMSLEVRAVDLYGHVYEGTARVSAWREAIVYAPLYYSFIRLDGGGELAKSLPKPRRVGLGTIYRGGSV